MENYKKKKIFVLFFTYKEFILTINEKFTSLTERKEQSS